MHILMLSRSGFYREYKATLLDMPYLVGFAGVALAVGLAMIRTARRRILAPCMIAFENVSMSYPTKAGPKVVIDNLSIVFDTRKSIGILGLNGAGKSTLIRLIGGVELPNSRAHTAQRQHFIPVGLYGMLRRQHDGARKRRVPGAHLRL